MSSSIGDALDSGLALIMGIVILVVDYVISDAVLSAFEGLLPTAFTVLFGLFGVLLLIMGIVNLASER